MLPLAGPEGFLRVNKAPMKAGPYTIPSGHMLIPSMSAIVMDKDSWREAGSLRMGNSREKKE